MKKLTIFCFLLVSVNCFSQGFVQGIVKRLTFGVKAGANYSNFTNANFKTDGLVGFHTGALVNLKLNEHFSIQEEFLFSSQGAKNKESVFGKENINVYYMAVPILLKYRTISGIYLEAGPQTNMLIKDNVNKSEVNGHFAKQLDFGAAAGFGFQSKSGLGIGARYVAGFSDVGDFKSPTIKTDFRNSVVQASVFYIF
ncbi:MAG TPA: porin family protein [Cyclobacteriaceae bacterium]